MTDHEKTIMRNLIYAVETGGEEYGKKDYADFTEARTNTPKEIAITIGAGQWYGSEAKTLLERIRQADPSTFSQLDTAGIASDLAATDWSKYDISKNSAKAKCIVRIIDTEIGHACQDQLIDEQMEKYIAEAAALGVTDMDAKMMCANFQHLGGKSAVTRILSKTATPYTLDNIYAASKTDTGNQVGTYRSRNKMVYDILKAHITNYRVTPEAAIEAVISVARNELGYLEKVSNSQLDSKTANAGKGNYTKYWRDLKPSYQGYSWCACFISWILKQAFGEPTARALLAVETFPYTWVDHMRTYRKNEFDTTPQVGDLVVFWSDEDDRYNHVGLVIASDGVNFSTIEGNTSAMKGVDSNGDGVYEKRHDIYNNRKPRFIHLDYTLVTAIQSGGSGEHPYPVEDNFQATGTATCTGNGVRVRATPDGTILGSLDYGTVFEVDGIVSGEWVHVKATGIGIGYMHQDYVQYESVNDSWTKTGLATCTGNGVYVRKTPGGSIIGQLYEGDQFETDGNQSDVWVHVKVSGIGIGYIHQDYVSTSTAWTKTGTAICTGNGVYVRETPGGTILGQLYEEDAFEVDGKRSGVWIHIKASGIGIGYIHQDYVGYAGTLDKTEPIKTAQTALNNRFGAGITVDGSWGLGSRTAYIKAIQKSLNSVYGAGLAVDGSFGAKTRAAVMSHVISRGAKNSYVAALQIGLYAHGITLANGVDESFGPSTELGTITYQMEVGIKSNGKAGIDTFSHLVGEADITERLKAFVLQMYTQGLGRTPSEEEQEARCLELLNGKTGTEFGDMVLFSVEFDKKNRTDSQFVDILYRTMLGREPDSGKSTFLNALSIGMSRRYVFYGFANSTEFQNRCKAIGITTGGGSSTEPRDQNPDITAFVYRLYKNCLERNPDKDGLNTWTNVLLNKTYGGKAVASGFFFSQEFINKNLSNTEFVRRLYTTLLNRTPDTGGLNTWVSLLNSGSSRQSVFDRFTASQEFTNLCNRYGIIP